MAEEDAAHIGKYPSTEDPDAEPTAVLGADPDAEPTAVLESDPTIDEPTAALVPDEPTAELVPNDESETDEVSAADEEPTAVVESLASTPESMPHAITPKPKKPGKAGNGMIGLIVLCSLLVLALIAGIVFLARQTDSPEKVVKNYLSAVSRGDATAALGYVVAPEDTGLLTETALKDALRITDISVKQRDGSSVEATYKLDGEQITTVYTVEKTGSRYRVTNPVATIQLPRTDKLAYSIGGSSSTAGKPVLVFPGGYSITPTDGRLALVNLGVVKAAEPKAYTPTASLGLTKQGVTDLRGKAQQSLTACATQKSLTPPNCPFAFAPPPNQMVKPDTIVWTVKTDPTQTLEFTVNERNLTAVSKPADFTLTLGATIGKSDGTSYAYEEDNTAKAAADFDLADPTGGLIWRQA